MAHDPRIDAYIAKAAPFAQPILEHLRALIHEAVPDVTEAVKWGMPHFVHRGKNLAGIAAFKAHASLILHNEDRGIEGMGSYGKIANLDELPPRVELIARFQRAAAEIDSGKKRAPAPAKPKAAIAVPQDFAAALLEAPKARATFDGLTDAQRREYLVWITEAKQEATRTKRIATSLEWLAEGKRYGWQYMKG
jgi:uncharacterized protein YdeI (YjbR/CyaY-like superfamily)